MVDFKKIFKSIKQHDALLFFSVLGIAIAGLLSINTFSSESIFFERQVIWLIVGIWVYFFVSFFDVRFLRKTEVVVSVYFFTLLILSVLLFVADPLQGAKSWFVLGPVAFQPSDPAKIVLIILLAKYFSRRHIEISNFKHILISGAYTFFLFFLVLLQPDFGTAIIIFSIWFFIVLVSGIQKKHLFFIFGLGAAAVTLMWTLVFQDYQKERIVSFIHPRTDIQGAGYNAHQSRIAVGSGEFLGKGVGYGTQSKLRFLPEYETDFIFATFAEEWGFAGVSVLLLLYFIVISKIISFARKASTNFESFFMIGVAALFVTHIVVHAGMNLGLLPVTGTTIPFMSYGGSHLLTEFLALGLVIAMRRHEHGTHRGNLRGDLTTV